MKVYVCLFIFVIQANCESGKNYECSHQSSLICEVRVSNLMDQAEGRKLWEKCVMKKKRKSLRTREKFAKFYSISLDRDFMGMLNVLITIKKNC